MYILCTCSTMFHWFMMFIILFQWFPDGNWTRSGVVASMMIQDQRDPLEKKHALNHAKMKRNNDHELKRNMIIEDYWSSTDFEDEEEHDNYDVCHDLVALFISEALPDLIAEDWKVDLKLWGPSCIVRSQLYHVESIVCPLKEDMTNKSWTVKSTMSRIKGTKQGWRLQLRHTHTHIHRVRCIECW